MEIRNDLQALNFERQQVENKALEKKVQTKSGDQAELEEAVEEFTSVLIQQMFSAMKNTLNDENRLLDGGYAEEVFDDMLYREYSKMAGQQSLLSELNRALLEQLQSK
ncbi:rod-binding protein [Halanaerobium sp. Z-7514]|uniref:Rod-binding protein n=1 Tax=Halanaerobium polyolivorans TaxID=2886943 RepID=A0AAW4WZU6_9FIRM|nr:rod-binding protein [Halanaerobium polyolivorans]